jgi:Flp pilus assembly protein TadG
MRAAATTRHRPRDERGSATVELAVAMPVVMLLLMLIVQAALYFHTRAVATTAAHKGLDAARVEEGAADDARTATETFLDRNASGLENQTVTVARSGDNAQVSVSGQVVSLVFGVDLFPLRVTARAPIEQVTP